MNKMRHVAKIANTDQRCVVVFMQIPGREDHCLIAPIDNLPPRMEQAVMDVLKSPQGQSEENFGVALARHLLPDTGLNIFETLHRQNRLVATPVHQVLMMPAPNQPVNLSNILESLGRLPNQTTQGLMQEYAVEKFNPHVNNQVVESNENSRAIARNLLIEAEMLEMDAKRKRERAYNIDPPLRPPVLEQPIKAATEKPVKGTTEPSDPLSNLVAESESNSPAPPKDNTAKRNSA